jgi:DNA-binding IclR family transcriptional regulator
MGFWEKSLRIFKSLCEAGTQSVRHLAQHTGISKSSAHRLKQAIERRDCYPEVEHRLYAQVEALEAFAHTQQLPNRQAAMHKVKKQLPALAALVDFW